MKSFIILPFLLLVSCGSDSITSQSFVSNPDIYKKGYDTYSISIDHNTDTTRDTITFSENQNTAYYRVEFTEYWEHEVTQVVRVCNQNNQCDISNLYSTENHIEICTQIDSECMEFTLI